MRAEPSPHDHADGDLLRLLAAHLDWLRMRGRADGTIYQRKRTILRLAAALDVRLLDATPADLLQWRSGLAVADPSVRTTVAHVRDWYAWLAAEGHVDVSPAGRLPVPRRERGLPRPIGEEELMQALRYAPPRVRPWLVLAGWCGLRAREIAWLRRDAILDRAVPPLIVVRAAAAKGGHERVVPMPPFVVEELRPVLPPSGWAFPRADGQPGPNAPWIVSQLAGEAIRQSGTDATLHQLRHRYATQLYKQTRDLRLVQELLGHSSPSITAVYADYDQTTSARAVAMLPVPGRRRRRRF